MAFNKENKVTYKELAPTLQAMLDAKATKTELQSHVTNTNMHITPTERKTWNAMLQAAKDYTDTTLKKQLGPITDSISGTSTNLTSLLNQKVDKSTFETFKTSLATVAHTGSYNDLKNQPSSLSYSDTANRALNADKAKAADKATNATEAEHSKEADHAKDADTIKGIKIFIQNSYPSDVANDKAILYHTGERMLYVYANNKWNMTGAALR